MSSDVIARVVAFSKKADELCDKGHVLRAAENYGRAAEAARALGADNLVTAYAQMRQAAAHCMYAAKAHLANLEPRIHAGHRAECIALYSAAVETLERRRVADTLLEGKCDAAEEAWRAAERQPNNGAHVLTPMFGYDQFMHTAVLVLSVLCAAHVFKAECSAVQFRSFAEHVVHAAELMQQPRRHHHNDAVMALEASFVKELRRVAADAGASGLDKCLVQLLTCALQRLQRSGVLQTNRTMEKYLKLVAPGAEAYSTAVHTSLNAPDLRRCALPGCGAREAHPAHFKSCAACRTVVYCCREHQVAGWPSHKKACKAACKAAAAEEDDGAGPSGA